MLLTPLHDWHQSHGARLVDFAGWQMPVQYSSITEEHHAVRRAAGLFDIAHMGRLTFAGPDAERFLDYLLTNDARRLKPGQVRYSLICNEQGGILDDVLIYRFSDSWMLVVNASNRLKILNWIVQHQEGYQLEVHDRTEPWFMLALQGPRSLDVLAPLVASDLAGMKYYTASETELLNQRAIVSRTGYTGEDGFELIVPAESAVTLWERLIEQGAHSGLIPCGLGCRDTLRLEAAMPLYGHEMDETVDPFTAGLEFGVKLDAGDFLGKAALLEKQRQNDRPKRVGLILEGKRIAREGSAVLHGGRTVGKVTSGTFSPTLESVIAMAYVEPACAAVNTELDVDIRGRIHPATVTSLPFYRRA